MWRERLFVLMARNAVRATAFFRLPPERVVELGVQVEILAHGDDGAVAARHARSDWRAAGASRRSPSCCALSRIIRTQPSRRCSSCWSCSRRRHPRTCECRSRISVAAMLVVQLLPAAAVPYADDRRPAELGGVVRVRRRGRDRQPALGGRPAAGERGGGTQAGGDAAVRSQSRHPADDRQRACDCRRRPICRPAFRARGDRHLPADCGWVGRASGRRTLGRAHARAVGSRTRAAARPTRVRRAPACLRRPSSWSAIAGPRSTLVPLRLGTKPVGILATQRRTARSGDARCPWGCRRDRHRARAFSRRTKEGRNAQSARRPGVGAPRVVQPRSANAGDVGSRRGHEPSGCHACRRRNDGRRHSWRFRSWIG